MKRTAAALVMLAGIGGCATTDSQTKKSGNNFAMPHKGSEVMGAVGPNGTPVMKSTTAAAKKAAMQNSDITQASAMQPMADGEVMQSAGFSRIIGKTAGCADGGCDTGHPGLLHGKLQGHGGHQSYGVDPNAYGPMGSKFGTLLGHNGIMPVPQMGPPGAVAAVGAIGPGSPYGAISNQRTSVRFVSPLGMQIAWFNNGVYTPSGLTAPADYNFGQGAIYRLKLSGIPTQATKVYYPTLEIMPTTLKSMAFLSHSSVPLSFSNDDFERVNTGNMVVKVIYLPDPAFQDISGLGGADEVVSTQLEPGADPIVEANRRGTILAVIRLGNIALENPGSPAMDAPPAGMMGGPSMMGAPPAMMGAPPAMMGAPGMMGAPPAMMPPAATLPGNMPAAMPIGKAPGLTIPTVTLPTAATPSGR